MARKREFNADIALNKAVELFWERGYANTSMREVVKHTGVAHAGIYTAFGNKDELFLAALLKYEQRIFTYLFGGIETERAAIKEIKKLFTFVTTATEDKYFKHGCFIANTALEFANKQGPINDVLSRTFERQVNAFKHALENAKNNNQVNAEINTSHIASQLTVLFYGCSTLTRMRAPKQIIEQAILGLFQAIERPH